jgi:hypothetical protein
VLRKLSLLALCGGALIPWAATRAQDAAQPSVADAARQARQAKEAKDKEKSATQPKKVLTNDDVASGTSGAAAGTAGLSGITVPSPAQVSSRESALANGGDAGAASSASGFPGAAAAAGGDDPMSKAWAGIGNAETALDRMAPMDRTTLAKVVLEGNNVDFPGRAAWEERLYTAKQQYVAHSRQLIGQMKELMAGAQAAQNGANADPQDLMSRAQRLLADATSTENSFKAVMQEGKDLALQASHR